MRVCACFFFILRFVKEEEEEKILELLRDGDERENGEDKIQDICSRNFLLFYSMRINKRTHLCCYLPSWAENRRDQIGLWICHSHRYTFLSLGSALWIVYLPAVIRENIQVFLNSKIRILKI